MTVGSPYAPPFEIAVTAYMPESGTYAPPASRRAPDSSPRDNNGPRPPPTPSGLSRALSGSDMVCKSVTFRSKKARAAELKTNSVLAARPRYLLSTHRVEASFTPCEVSSYSSRRKYGGVPFSKWLASW
jgi:hypothetical protein